MEIKLFLNDVHVANDGQKYHCVNRGYRFIYTGLDTQLNFK